MIKPLALAGETAALVIGSIAVAQTASDPNNNPNTNNNPAATAPNANQNGANTSATDNNPNGAAADTGTTANTSATGERG